MPPCPHCGATSTRGRQTVGIQEAADLTGYSVRQVGRLAGVEVPGGPRPKVRVLSEAAGARKLSLLDVLALRKARGSRATGRG